MKKHILAGISMVALAAALQPAAAADLPVAYRAPQNYVIFTWTGFYFGAHGGGAWGTQGRDHRALRRRRSPRRAARNNIDISGGLAGGQIGANYQAGSWVFGVEADASWADLTGNNACAPASSGSRRTAAPRSTRSAPSPAGWASRSTASCSTARAALPSPTTSTKSTRSPRTAPTRPAGAGWWARGIEYSFTDNWSAKIEYNYLDFGTRAVRFTDTTGFFALDTSIRERIHVAKVGINYRFGWAPVGVTY